ncbi:MAG: hypothetical protein H0X14_12205, partial [Acidobacteria bacterium]|nr:hypothetical protein [Acidobacteriota bacterium]
TQSVPAPRRVRPVVAAPAPVVNAPTAPPPPRSSVEMIEGSKKRNVDFP